MANNQKYIRRFTLTVQVAECAQEFKEGCGPGVLVTQDVEYNCTKREYERPMFLMDLNDKAEALKDRFIKTVIEEQTIDIEGRK